MKWLILRRISQLTVLGFFLFSSLTGIWVLRGDLAGSTLFGFIPLSDPLTLLQTMLSGHWPELTALVGVVIILLFYLLAGGRVFCSWVCPVNIINDSAVLLQKKMPLKPGGTLGSSLRYWLLAAVLLAALVSGTTLWEGVSPVNVFSRSVIFGLQSAVWMGAALFIFGLLLKGGWCRICPTGALFGLLGRFSLFRVRIQNLDKCDHCNACFEVCPEPQILSRPLNKEAQVTIIASGHCTNCGRCIDVCPHAVFRFGRREF